MHSHTRMHTRTPAHTIDFNTPRLSSFGVKKLQKNFDKNFSEFVFGAVQGCVNLVDLKKMLENAYLVAKIGVDTAENEPSKV